jgi:hypothetical protein
MSSYLFGFEFFLNASESNATSAYGVIVCAYANEKCAAAWAGFNKMVSVMESNITTPLTFISGICSSDKPQNAEIFLHTGEYFYNELALSANSPPFPDFIVRAFKENFGATCPIVDNEIAKGISLGLVVLGLVMTCVFVAYKRTRSHKGKKYNELDGGEFSGGSGLFDSCTPDPLSRPSSPSLIAPPLSRVTSYDSSLNSEPLPPLMPCVV